jgi:hypothetical protein
MSRVIEDYRLMASRCLLLAAETTDEQHKSVLLRAAAKFNELADRHRYRLAHRQRHSFIYGGHNGNELCENLGDDGMR